MENNFKIVGTYKLEPSSSQNLKIQYVQFYINKCKKIAYKYYDIDKNIISQNHIDQNICSDTNVVSNENFIGNVLSNNDNLIITTKGVTSGSENKIKYFAVNSFYLNS